MRSCFNFPVSSISQLDNIFLRQWSLVMHCKLQTVFALNDCLLRFTGAWSGKRLNAVKEI